MTQEPPRRSFGRVSVADLYGRWGECLREARTRAGGDASTREILLLAASRWTHEMPPELAFVSDEIHDFADVMRHETTEERLIERVVRGALVALRRVDDGSVIYARPGEARTLLQDRPDQYEPYDPLLARALREHALEEEAERLDERLEE